MNQLFAQKQAYMKAMIEQENLHIQRSKQAFQIAEQTPLIGSFYEDAPHIHQTFAGAHMSASGTASSLQEQVSETDT